VAARATGDQHAPSGSQAVLTDFIDQGHFAAYLSRLRTVLAERYDALMYALATHCGTMLDPWPANAGMHLVAWLPAGTAERAVVREAARAGIEVRGLGRLRQVPGAPGLVLGFGRWGVPAITDAAQRLGRALSQIQSELSDGDQTESPQRRARFADNRNGH
jgi:GntR family transcriptional regulator/MocR family aminotransferase